MPRPPERFKRLPGSSKRYIDVSTGENISRRERARRIETEGLVKAAVSPERQARATAGRRQYETSVQNYLRRGERLAGRPFTKSELAALKRHTLATPETAAELKLQVAYDTGKLKSFRTYFKQDGALRANVPGFIPGGITYEELRARYDRLKQNAGPFIRSTGTRYQGLRL
jgi:hypothetical protein